MGDFTTITVHILLFISLYFEVFLLLTFLEQYPDMKKKAPATVKTFPSATIIVPCYNEEQTIAKTITSLLALDYPQEKLSIIVVNDGSTDKTAQALEPFATNPRMRIFHKENKGKYAALNFALGLADSELVGCLDADSFVEQNALKEIIPYFKHRQVAAVTPAIKVYNPRNIIQLIQKAEYNLSIFIRRVFSFIDGIFITPGPFSIFKTKILQSAGGYKHAYNTEDLEIALRLQSKGYRIENAHTAHVYTTVPKTLSGLFRQRLRWTYGFLKNIIDYRFMFFKEEYGNLGILILPIVTLSIFSAIYFLGLLLTRLGVKIFEKIIEFQTVGTYAFSSSLSELSYINTNSILFLVSALVLLTLTLVLIGKKLSADKVWSVDLPLYLFLYGLLAPWWLARAVYNTALSKEVKWK